MLWELPNFQIVFVITKKRWKWWWAGWATLLSGEPPQLPTPSHQEPLSLKTYFLIWIERWSIVLVKNVKIALANKNAISSYRCFLNTPPIWIRKIKPTWAKSGVRLKKGPPAIYEQNPPNSIWKAPYKTPFHILHVRGVCHLQRVIGKRPKMFLRKCIGIVTSCIKLREFFFIWILNTNLRFCKWVGLQSSNICKWSPRMKACQ